MLEMVDRLQDKVASVQQNSMLCPLLPCCCCWRCGDSILATSMRTWLVQIFHFIKPLHCVMWVGGWSKFLLYGRWRNMISIFLWCSGSISVLENELMCKATVWVSSLSWQAFHFFFVFTMTFMLYTYSQSRLCDIAHVTWVIEPSVLHICAQISARVLEWVFFAFPHSLNPCDMTCPAGVARKCVDCRFHSFAEYCKLVWVPWFCCFK